MPNQLFDKLLPTLKDSELRVLLVLIRSTSGWNRAGQPVTLTYRQLQARTGRHSEAIANAIGSLATRGLIHAGQRRRFRNPKGVGSVSARQQTETE